MTAIIEIVISPDGQTKLETKGFGGQSCRDSSRFLEQALRPLKGRVPRTS
jgi:hypothetical protein